MIEHTFHDCPLLPSTRARPRIRQKNAKPAPRSVVRNRGPMRLGPRGFELRQRGREEAERLAGHFEEVVVLGDAAVLERVRVACDGDVVEPRG